MVCSTTRTHFTPGKDPVPIVQESGWAPGPVWRGGKSRPHRVSIPDRPARSSVAISTELPGPPFSGGTDLTLSFNDLKAFTVQHKGKTELCVASYS